MSAGLIIYVCGVAGLLVTFVMPLVWMFRDEPAPARLPVDLPTEQPDTLRDGRTVRP